MKNYFKRFVEEKGISENTIEVTVNDEFHLVEMPVLIDFISNTPKAIQDQIRAMIVRIDFANGDIMDYMKFLAVGMIKATY